MLKFLNTKGKAVTVFVFSLCFLGFFILPLREMSIFITYACRGAQGKGTWLHPRLWLWHAVQYRREAGEKVQFGRLSRRLARLGRLVVCRPSGGHFRGERAAAALSL